MSQATLAVIIGNRDFFPDRLVSEGRQEILAVLAEMGVEPVIVGESDTKLGAVETWEHARRCGDLFKAHRDRIDGILVVLPSACEVDITGVASMYALQLASGTPSALVDWNNNYAGNSDKCVFFHCGNWAKSFVPDIEISTAAILGSTLGLENTYGAMAGRVPAGPMSYARISTDDRAGVIRTYVGDAEFTDDPLDTFGNRAVVHVPGLARLLRYICKNGFEHHVAMSASHSAAILAEAFETYLGWEVYHHR